MISRRTYIRVFQILIAVCMLIFLFSQINMGKINTLIYDAKKSYIFLAFMVLVFQIIIAAYRWLGLLRINQFSPPVWQCVGSFAASSFMNTTLPGGIGGDIMRTWVTVRNGVPAGIATYTVISDRILNLTGYGLLVTIALFSYLLCMREPLSTINMFALSFGVILLVGFAGLALIAPILTHFKIRLPLILSPVGALSSMISMIFHHPHQTITLIGTNLLVHFMQITALILLGYSLHVSLSLQAIFIGIPVVLLLAAVPITPGGWGIRESTMVLVLGQYQVTAEVALGISILFGLGTTLASVPTAAWWFVRINRVSKLNIPIISINVLE